MGGTRMSCWRGVGGEQKEEEEAADRRKRADEVCLSFKMVKLFRVQREGGSWVEVTCDG